jgi:hypothetical protein
LPPARRSDGVTVWCNVLDVLVQSAGLEFESETEL